MRYFLFLKYKGTRYHGWQRQPGESTVQQVLEEALSLRLKERIAVTGAGRTDTGVHAEFYAAHFDTPQTDLHKNKNFIFSLNRFLPEDIAITGITRVVPDASARYSAISRTYKYRVARQKNPFLTDISLLYTGPLDVDTMNIASGLLTRYSDFASFCRADSDVKTTICRVSEALWIEKEGVLEFTITADRFLRNMVRAISGTLLDIGKGKRSGSDFAKIIEACDRKAAGQSAPARGLSLTAVIYPDEIFSY